MCSRNCTVFKSRCFFIFSEAALVPPLPAAYLCDVPTPAELTFLLFSIIFTNLIVEYMSQAKLRRESNPKLVQNFPLHAAF